MAQDKKVRLDILMVKRGISPTRSKAQAMIMAGTVKVNGTVASKAGLRVKDDVDISIASPSHPYVSRGGVKLKKALSHFSINVKGKRCIDVGASTGGFTHCLLLEGALQVIAIDVGYGQLDWALRQDKRVIVMEKTNFRLINPSTFPYKPVEILTIDVSFISLRLILPVARQLVTHGAYIIALIKPQFEVGPKHVGKGGIVRDKRLYEIVINDIKDFSKRLGLTHIGVIESPILGAKGNREFLIALTA